MVFPTIHLQVESGLIPQLSFWIVMGLAYTLRFWKKTIIVGFILILSFFVGKKAFSFSMVPGGCGTMCVNNTQYYGMPMGNPFYYYPTLPYHSFYGPTPYYFMPHGPSPYRPNWLNNCPYCQMQQMNLWGPQFNPINHGPAS